METQEQSTYDFSHALRLLKDGIKIARKGWNGKNMWLELQTPDENSKMTMPYIFMTIPPIKEVCSGGESCTAELKVPWFASQTDLLACDWEIVE